MTWVLAIGAAALAAFCVAIGEYERAFTCAAAFVAILSFTYLFGDDE